MTDKEKEIKELKSALSDAIRSFTRLETLYKVRRNELEIANDKIVGLTGKCEALQKDNENLRRTLEEGAEVVEKVKLDTAKRIYQKLYDLCTRDDNPFRDYDLCAEDIVEWAKEEGVEIDEK